MKALLKIINLHFWKSIIGPFFAFGFPIIFIAILGMMLGYYSMFGGMLAISAMAVSLTSMPQAIYEFKRSSLLKRIGVTPIKPYMFIIAAICYYIVVMIIGTFFSIIIGIAIFSGNMNNGKEIMSSVMWIDGKNYPLYSVSLGIMLSNVNWGGFIWGMLLNILVGASLGMLLVSICKSTMLIQGIGIPILILSQFLTAQVLPVDMVRKVDALWYLGYISPFKSTTSLLIQSWNGCVDDPAQWTISIVKEKEVIQQTMSGSFNVFDMDANYQVVDSKSSKMIDVFSKPERILNMILPFAWIGLFFGLSVKFFKWSNR